MSRLTREPKPIVRVRVHDSPSLPTPRLMPTSPDELPTFVYDLDRRPLENALSVAKQSTKCSSISMPTTKFAGESTRVKEKQNNKPRAVLPKNRNQTHTPAAKKVKAAVSANEGSRNVRRAFTATDIDGLHKKSITHSARDVKTANHQFQTLFKNEFPPYNPSIFALDESNSDSNEDAKPNKMNKPHSIEENKKMLAKIRQELDQWKVKDTGEENNLCPEQWSSNQANCEKENRKIIPKKKNELRIRGRSKECAKKGVKSTLNFEENMQDEQLFKKGHMEQSISFSYSLPKTPPPIPRVKTLHLADQLLSIAEREFCSVQAKLPANVSSAVQLQKNVPVVLSPRAAMTEIVVDKKQSSVIDRCNPKSGQPSRYNVPHNSPSFSNNTKTDDRYTTLYGKQKDCTSRTGTHSRHLKSSDFKSESDRLNHLNEHNTAGYLEESTQTEMFHGQKWLPERKECKYQEPFSMPFNTKSEPMIKSKNSISKCDIETNTDAEDNIKQSHNANASSNTCLVNIKSCDPEPEKQSVTTFQKRLNLQKMPSLNIRPEFTIHKGPKININGSNSKINQPRKSNNELFDVVYPLSNNFLNNSELEKSLLHKSSYLEYVCERHSFPSGRLVLGRDNKPNRQCGNYNTDLKGKKEILAKLIKSVSEKINKQSIKGGDCSCSLLHSLPLLASVVNKVHVECVFCENALNKHLDQLISLMKEELRNQRYLTRDHCCQFDETVQYQIVELELIQYVNCQEAQSSDEVKFIKHQDAVHTSNTLQSSDTTTSKACENSDDAKGNKLLKNCVNSKISSSRNLTIKNTGTIVISDQQILKNRQSCTKETSVRVTNQIEDEGTTTDIDKWIEEHHEKIKQIHGKLNSIVTTSEENNGNLQLSNAGSPKENKNFDLIHKSPGKEEVRVNETRSENHRKEIDDDEISEPGKKQKSLEEQDDCVDYSDDFEDIDDVSEGSTQNSTDDQPQENSGDSVSKCSSIPIINKINQNEEEDKQKNIPAKDYVDISLPQHQPLADVEAEVKCHVSSSNAKQILKSDIVDAGTSPINVMLPQCDESFALNMTSDQKTTIATSPIIHKVNCTPEYISTKTQTSPNLITDTTNEHPLGNLSLTVPCDKLKPSPVERIIESLNNKSCENNSHSFVDTSTNNMAKLIVQLPELSILVNGSQNNGMDLKVGDCKLKLSTDNLKEESTQTDVKYSKTGFHEQKSVISLPDKQNMSSHFTKEQPDSISLGQLDLLKPDLILKTNLGLWKKCDEKPVFIDVAGEKLTNDSAIQTETEKHNIASQTTIKKNVMQIDKAVSLQNTKHSGNVQEKSYLHICQLPRSFPVHTGYNLSSSTCHTSSRSSSHSSASLKYLQREVLSEGEVMPAEDTWNCVPKLDLSLGELKTTQGEKMVKTARSETDTYSSSDLHSVHSQSQDIPLHLSPSSSLYMMSYAPGDFGKKTPLTPKYKRINFQKSNPHINLGKYDSLHLDSKLSEVTMQVQKELNSEKSKHNDESSTFFDCGKNGTVKSIHSRCSSSSDSNRSTSSTNYTRKKNKLHKRKCKLPLKINSPLEIATIDMVIEDNDTETSYQTSLTSVSVDNLPGTLIEQSSGEL